MQGMTFQVSTSRESSLFLCMNPSLAAAYEYSPISTAQLLGPGRVMYDFALYPLTLNPDVGKYLLPKN